MSLLSAFGCEQLSYTLILMFKTQSFITSMYITRIYQRSAEIVWLYSQDPDEVAPGPNLTSTCNTQSESVIGFILFEHTI